MRTVSAQGRRTWAKKNPVEEFFLKVYSGGDQLILAGKLPGISPKTQVPET